MYSNTMGSVYCYGGSVSYEYDVIDNSGCICYYAYMCI